MADRFGRVMRSMGHSPFARAMMIASRAAALPPPRLGDIEVDAKTLETIDPPKPPPAPPQTQRLQMIDEAGLRYLNESRAKRGKRNAKRARDFARQQKR